VNATLRLLTSADADAYTVLRREMLNDSPLSFSASPETDIAADETAVREMLGKGPAQATMGAFVSGALVGAVGMFAERDAKAAHKIRIWGMYVRPAVRRAGVGRALMQAAIAHIRRLDGISQIQLSVSASAPGAQQLYESLGFEVWGVEPDALRYGGRCVDEHHMVLPLER